jgi:NAD-dependent dihydropyrimidine dehydrogenase PreA subunit
MSFIIGNKCVGCIDGSCLKVCPIDCIHGPIYIDGAGKELEEVRKNGVENMQLYIDPTECINCGACVPECPVDAIYSTEKEAISVGDEKSVHLNYEFFGLTFEKK